MIDKTAIAPMKAIEQAIFMIRGQRVMIDSDPAELYGVTTKALNQAVKRNEQRFPSDFSFLLTKGEKDQLVTICDRLHRLKHSSALPRAFTEQGVAMLSSVLKSERAVQVNVEIMRAFVRFRQMLGTHKELEQKIALLEKRYDKQFKVVFEALRALMEPPQKPIKKIGFAIKEPAASYGSMGKKAKQ